MFYKILADILVIIHFVWILFLLFGTFWGVRSKVVRMVHLSGLFFAILIEVFGWYCPLTDIELWLRLRHDPSLTYTGSFIIHYVEKVVYLEISQTAIFIATVFFSLFNAWIYFGSGRHKVER